MGEGMGHGVKQGQEAGGWPGAARLAFGSGAALAVAAAVALWASEGARVFADAALAAVVACF